MLRGRVAVVTGASRGIGKGIALGLGEAGATVYVTGRTVASGGHALPGTITETADRVSALGGHGIAVRCDHSNDDETGALIRRVQEEQGRLDLLVNNAVAQPVVMPEDVPFWDLPLDLWDQMYVVGLRSTYVASALAAPIMIEQGRGLIVIVSSVGAVAHFYNAPYHVMKSAETRLAAVMAHDLRPYHIAAVALWPGLTKTEKVMMQADSYDLSGATSPLFNGRAVAALATDGDIMEKTGQALRVTDLAREYRFTDQDTV